MAEDFYNVLGVEKGASQDEVKKAYRKLAKEHHPHKGGDAEKFKKVNEAYETLGDEKKRGQYDQFGSAGPQFGGGSGGFSGFGGGGGGVEFDFGGMDDVFSSFFGGGGGAQRQRSTRGGDLEVAVELDFEESVRGVIKKFNATHHVKCDGCDGAGGENPEKCDECGGSGRVTRPMQTPFGAVAQQATCPVCSGAGTKFAQQCGQCHGEGRLQKTRKIEVDIPAGVQEGETLRVRGEGEAGWRGGESGDLFVHVQVKDSRKFERRGLDLVTELKLDVWDALAGGKFSVETFWKKVDLTVPELTVDGSLLRIAGQGIKRGSRKGDHLVRVIHKMPKKLSAAQRELLEKLKK